MAAENNQNVNDAIHIGSVVLRVLLSAKGRPYLLLSRPLQTKIRGKVCWFPEDWQGIKAAIPQVQTLLNADVETERKVRTTIRDNREVVFVVKRSKLTAGDMFKRAWTRKFFLNRVLV